MNKNYPIFIGGASRSGTTLLVDMLGLHPNLSPIYETDFVLDVAKILFSQRKQGREEISKNIIKKIGGYVLPM